MPTKATTATDYAELLIEGFGEDVSDLVFEMPDWLLEAALEGLHEAFDKPYWQEANDATREKVAENLAGHLAACWATIKSSSSRISRLGMIWWASSRRARKDLGLVQGRGFARLARRANPGTCGPLTLTWSRPASS